MVRSRAGAAALQPAINARAHPTDKRRRTVVFMEPLSKIVGLGRSDLPVAYRISAVPTDFEELKSLVLARADLRPPQQHPFQSA